MKRYYITDRKAVGGFHPLLEIIRDQMHLGVDLIQIREKDIGARQLFEFTLAVLEVRERDFPSRPLTKILINERSDVAEAAKADGVHLPAQAPKEVAPGLVVIRSCHALEEVRTARADAIAFGPVFLSPGKGEPTGIPILEQACKLGKPIFALGGVTWENAHQCMAAGAVGIAGIRLFQDPDL